MCTQQMLWEPGELQKYFCWMQRGPIKSNFVMHLIGRRKAHTHKQCAHVFLYGTALRVQPQTKVAVADLEIIFTITSIAQAWKGPLIFKVFLMPIVEKRNKWLIWGRFWKMVKTPVHSWPWLCPFGSLSLFSLDPQAGPQVSMICQGCTVPMK